MIISFIPEKRNVMPMCIQNEAPPVGAQSGSRAFTNSWGGGGGSWNLMLSSNLLKLKIPILCVCGGGGGFAEIDAEFKFAKIQNSHFMGGGGFAQFDAEFKFAEIQNSHFVGGEGGWWNQFPTFDAVSKFALKKKKFFLQKIF